ncbi:MAG: hypothetical protein KA760_11460 [Steroidobacteraceae bacterium]|nr:hypothetical protein [Steroidobacteraceae bacterium]
MDIWTAVLSSAAVSGAVSALVSGWFGLRSTHKEYANAYYKLILERRMAAYEEIERLIMSIKVAVVDVDNRPYHLLFSDDDNHGEVYRQLQGVMSKSLWLTDTLFEVTREFNVLVYSGLNHEASTVAFGKHNYAAIAAIRTKMEKIHAIDMLTLHDAPAFLKGKKPSDTYEPLPPRG